MMAARAAEDWVENVVSNGWRATTLGQVRSFANGGYGAAWHSVCWGTSRPTRAKAWAATIGKRPGGWLFGQSTAARRQWNGAGELYQL